MKQVLLIFCAFGAGGVIASTALLWKGQSSPETKRKESSPLAIAAAPPPPAASPSPSQSSAGSVRHPAQNFTQNFTQAQPAVSSAQRLRAKLHQSAQPVSGASSPAVSSSFAPAATSFSGAVSEAGSAISGGAGNLASSQASSPDASRSSRSDGVGSSGGSSPTSAGPSPETLSAEEASADIPVPLGAKVPAAFFDESGHSPQQQKVLDKIAEDFSQSVSTQTPGVTAEENWEAARQLADQRYMTLFGYQAYNQQHIKAAKEALKEKQAATTP
jgi:hypothetical protein